MHVMSFVLIFLRCFFLWQPVFLDNNVLVEQLSSYLPNCGPLKTFNKKINGGHLKKKAYQNWNFRGIYVANQ